jgi:hypothetical protein
MIEFIGPLYDWLQQFTNHYLTLSSSSDWTLRGNSSHFQLNWTPLLRCTPLILVLIWGRESYFTTGGLSPINSSWRQAPWHSRPVILFSYWIVTVIALMQNPLWRQDGSVVYNWCWVSPAQSFSGPSPPGLMTTFYCLKFETPPTWGARSRIYTSHPNRVARLYPQALGSLFVSYE